MRQIITDFWTPDKDTQLSAYDAASRVKDERIGFALIGVLAAGEAKFPPPLPYDQRDRDGIDVSRWKVNYIWDTGQYQVVGPDARDRELFPEHPTTGPIGPVE